MKRKIYLTHGAIIATGLLLGLLAQAAIRSNSAQPIQVSLKSKTSRKITRTDHSSEKLSLVLNLIKRDGRDQTKRTLEEEAVLNNSLYELNSQDYLEIVEVLIERNTPADMALIQDLFSAWGLQAPHDALKAMRTMPRSMQHRIEFMVLQGWISSDAKAAFTYFDKEYPSLPNQRARESLRKDLWGDFASENPKQALALASGITDSQERHTIEDEIIRRMSYQNPEEALRWVLAHREGEGLQEKVASLIDGWSQVGKPREILDQILSLPEEFQTNDLFKGLGDGLGRKIDGATELLDKIPEVHRDQFLGGLIADAARYTPERAVELSQLLPDGKIKQQAYSDIGESWADEDPVAAGEWLVTLPRSPARDQAIKGFTQSQSSGDPALVVAWASDIDNRSLKRTPLINGLQRWIDNDATAARKWMDAQPEERLPAAIKQQILENFSK